MAIIDLLNQNTAKRDVIVLCARKYQPAPGLHAFGMHGSQCSGSADATYTEGSLTLSSTNVRFQRIYAKKRTGRSIRYFL